MVLSGQEKLKQARVLCVGLGGLGSPLLLYLAASGVGRLGIVDDDWVDLSNLQRQILYRTSQVNAQKTESAKAELFALNPLIQVNAYSEKLTEFNAANLMSQYDIIADGSDNFYTRYLIHDTCFKLKKPYVYASASQFQGYTSIFQGENGPCLRCLFPSPPDSESIPNCNESGVFGVLTGMLGIIQATEIIKWIVKIGQSLEKRLLIIDSLKMTFKEIQLFQSPDCPLCVRHQSLSYGSPPTQCLKKYGITLEQFYNLDEKTILVDVRTAKEHETHNIGGKSLPLGELPYRLQELNTKDTIILYCHSGKRSLLALNILLEAGFSSVKYIIQPVIS